MGDSLEDAIDNDRWPKYEVYRLAMATETARVDTDHGPVTIEEGDITIGFCKNDSFPEGQSEWVRQYSAPDADEGVARQRTIRYERLEIGELPRPMTAAEAYQWIVENSDCYREETEVAICSDVAAEDVLDGGVQ